MGRVEEKMKSSKISIKKRFWWFVSGIVLVSCCIVGVIIIDNIENYNTVVSVTLDTVLVLSVGIVFLSGIGCIIIYLLIIALSWMSSFARIPKEENKQKILETLTQIDSVISSQMTPEDLLIILNELRIIELELKLSEINGTLKTKQSELYDKIKNLTLNHIA